ncbi:phosphoserine phosphatase SerB [Conchiformibius steedae DSM 2580]|uniref:Phosphoserine phosphatase n=1 Tax=Conchiformibius steedae DSM 2580 TaxID=1121352 RepID=A0AAE9HWS6_9NEIS|nr:phosphoserine phosphatase SerB [Conchiformibius steedae]QMT34454.1 phosphoserine phosphatase SerB [Conchiformibius steedae]URD67235.1 phosphoserine phosphatase SerB [Conchiformibius steedae DSM 2580]
MNHTLVIQHSDLSEIKFPNTAARFGQALAGKCVRIPLGENAVLDEHIRAELDAAPVDYAVLPERTFDSFGLLASDMDSTLITIECIDEIAQFAGLKTQIAEITERAMQGGMDFAQSLHQRVALLEGVPESALEHVYQNVLRLSAGAETLIQACRRHGVKTLLVSGGFTYFTDRLKQKLGLDYAYANELEIKNGYLTGRVLGRVVDAEAKAQLLAQHREQLGLSSEQTLAVGDGANDIPMFRAATFGIAYRAKAAAQQAADLRINHNGLDAVRGWFA